MGAKNRIFKRGADSLALSFLCVLVGANACALAASRNREKIFRRASAARGLHKNSAIAIFSMGRGAGLNNARNTDEKTGVSTVCAN